MAERRRRRASAVIVVILPDGGRNYLSKLYNDEWMRANGLLATTGARRPHRRAPRRPPPRRPTGRRSSLARTTERVGEAIDLLQQYGISQMPVSEDAEGDAVAGIVGSISEKGLLDRAYRDPSIVERTVGEVMDAPLPLVDASATLDEAFALLSGGAPALVAVRGERPAGVVTKLDLLEYLAHRPRLTGRERPGYPRPSAPARSVASACRRPGGTLGSERCARRRDQLGRLEPSPIARGPCCSRSRARWSTDTRHPRRRLGRLPRAAAATHPAVGYSGPAAGSRLAGDAPPSTGRVDTTSASGPRSHR